MNGLDWGQVIQTVLAALGGGFGVYAGIKTDLAKHAVKIGSLEKSVDRIEAHLWERRGKS
jgi:hypothetical protein